MVSPPKQSSFVRSAWRAWGITLIVSVPFLAFGYSGAIVKGAKTSPFAPPHPTLERDSHDIRNYNAHVRSYRVYYDYYDEVWRRATIAFFAIQAAGLVLAGFVFWLLPRDGSATGDKTLLALIPLLNIAVTFMGYVAWGFREG